jgi:formylglycine-generating enzyme required for sulfatase activity
LDNYKHNVNILQREEEARSIGMSAVDIQENITSMYASIGQDVVKLRNYINLLHNAVLGLLIDEYYLLHAPLHERHNPLMPSTFSKLLKEYHLEIYQQLIAGFAPYYEAMYELLIAANPMSSADFYLDLSGCCHLLGDATASERALYKSVKAFLHWRGVETQVAASCLTYLQVPLAYQYVKQTDMNYIDKVNVLCQKVFPNQPIPLITTADLSIWERKQREETERKRREEEARQEAERKRKEEAVRQEAERKRREEAARQEGQRKEKAIRKSSFTSYLYGVPFLEMVFVQGGTFTTNTNSYGDTDMEKMNGTSVNLGDFHIGKYPVTQAQWRAVMGNNPSYFSGCDNCPVENVSQYDVEQFIVKLNELSEQQGNSGRYSLPTGVQWEYAARGGQLSKGYKYSGSNNLYEVGLYLANSGLKTHAVGSKRANELGLYDMSGNVWEWCYDIMSPNVGSYRGGSWDSDARRCHSMYKFSDPPSVKFNALGFRLCWFPS